MLSASQARRRYGLEIIDLTEAQLAHDRLHVFAVEGIQVFKGPVRLYNFVSASPLDLLEAASQIIHQVGTAEMRWHLGAPRTWEAQGGALAATERPDAVFHRADGPCAIEYDTGSYSSGRVEQKLGHFKDFAHIYWGCSSPERVKRLQRRYLEHPKLTVFHAAWWL